MPIFFISEHAQKAASAVVWKYNYDEGMGNSHICPSSIDTERYMQVLEQHMQLTRQIILWGRFYSFQLDKYHRHMLQLHAFVSKVQEQDRALCSVQNITK